MMNVRPELVGGHGFSDRSLVKDYVENGRLPKIHEDVGAMLSLIRKRDRAGLLDLGACTGLLTVRARALGFTPVVGLELRQQDVDVFTHWLKQEDTELRQFRMDPADDACLTYLHDLIVEKGVTTVLARRCLPEFLGATEAHHGNDSPKDAGERLSACFAKAGVQRMVIEGRTFSSRSVHRFAHVNTEVEAMSSHFFELRRTKNTVMLLRRP